ncbi:hypothetical protein MPER_09337, partial [Moniliophthora perniciosa FA553]
MEMYDENDEHIIEEEVFGDLVCNNCDTPGARKFSGLAGHSADMNPCPWCYCTSLDINRGTGYIIDGFKLRDEEFMIKQKFFAKNEPHRQEEILARHGVQFSALDWIPGWRPGSQTALDFMHCVFLGVVAWLFTKILFAAHMFYGAGPYSGRKRFEDAINSIKWPSHITRLPKNLGENQSLKKADEWRTLLTIAPVVLWLSWRNETNDEIPDTEPPVAPNEVIKTKHSRKRKSLYEVILMLCAGVRILSMRQISMRAELSINHHLAMHFGDMFKLYGPVYAWWLFAYERFNGMFEQVKLNGHGGGAIEHPPMRYW